jgi:HSP20 family molecular chaperone IbpA
MKVDILENENEYLVIADVPGVAANAISVELKEEHLAISGNVQEGFLGDDVQRSLHVESYARSFELPEFIDRDKVTADLKQGVLTVHLPKTEAVKPRQIQVQAG